MIPEWVFEWVRRHHPTLHYKLDREALRDSFSKFLRNEGENFENGNPKIGETLTDTTTDTTTEITTEKKNIYIPPFQQKKKVVLKNHENLAPQNPEQFNHFWEAYPKKANKIETIKAWNKLNPSPELMEQILTAIEKAKESEQWKQKDGLFIPYPHNFLKDRRWEDELTYVKDWREI